MAERPKPTLIHLLNVCNAFLDGWRLERSSSKTSRSDRRCSDAKEVPVLTSAGPLVRDGGFRAKTGNGPWCRGDTAEEALSRLLRRRLGPEAFVKACAEVKAAALWDAGPGGVTLGADP